MVRLIIEVTDAVPDGVIAGTRYKTVDIENAELEQALKSEQSFQYVSLVGAEVRP